LFNNADCRLHIQKFKYSGNHNSKYYISILQIILLDFIYDTKGSHINYIDQSHKMEEKRVKNRSKTKDYWTIHKMHLVMV